MMMKLDEVDNSKNILVDCIVCKRKFSMNFLISNICKLCHKTRHQQRLYLYYNGNNTISNE